MLNLDEFSEVAMDLAMDYCEIADNTVFFHFRDGHFEKRGYLEKKRGVPWTPERFEIMKKCFKEYRSEEENRKAASRRMKKIRKERKWSSL